MEAASRKQEEIDREQAWADLETIKDHIDDSIYKMLLRWINREPEYLRGALEKIEFLMEFHRFAWGKVPLPEPGSGEGLLDIE
jgi:hypothetical protein